MAGKTRRASIADCSPTDALEYRRPMQVSEIMVISSACGETGWAVCPRCGMTMDREFMSFCDRCGQRLGWSAYKKAKVIYPGTRKANTL